MKINIYLLAILLCLNFNSFSQSSCTGLTIRLDSNEHCWYPAVNNQTINNTYYTVFTTGAQGSRFTLWRRDSGTTNWLRLQTRTLGSNGAFPTYNTFQLQNSSLGVTFSTLPNTAPAVLFLVISTDSVATNYTNAPNAPFTNGACFSNIIKTVIKPVPSITVNPDNTIRSYCRNNIVNDTLWANGFGTNSSNNTNISFQWWAAGSNTNAIGIGSPIAGATNRFYIPPTVCSGSEGHYGYYYCRLSNQYGCGVNSNISGKISLSDTVWLGDTYTTICDYKADSFYFHNVKVDTAHRWPFMVHSLNVSGCDTSARLFLSITASPKKITTVSLCAKQMPYTWNITGQTYYKDTSITIHHLYNNNSCDSLYILNLTVKKSSSYTINKIICSGDTVKIGTNKYYTTGSFKDSSLRNRVDCDSFISLNLTVLPAAVTKDTSFSICPGGSVSFLNKRYDSTGKNYKDTLRNILRCDSIRYNITIAQLYASSSTTSASICSNQSFTWNGISYNTAGTKTKHFNNKAGCDSIATLILTVKNTSTSTTSLSICNTQFPYNWYGTSCNTAGTYTKTGLHNSLGCDSTAVLNLSTKVTSSSLKDTTICENCSYLFNGISYHTSGTYSATLTNAVGCDSIATLILRVGLIGGDTVKCKTDTAYYFVNSPQANIHYYWYANNGTTYGNNPDTTIKVLWDSTKNTYITLTAKDSANHILYSDTIRIKVGKQPLPLVSIYGGVGCQIFRDSISDQTTGVHIPILDTTSTNPSCTNVCEHNIYTYHANGNVGSNYIWAVPQGGIIIGANNLDSVQVKWDSAGKTASLTIEEHTLFGCVGHKNYCFTIINTPKVHLSSFDFGNIKEFSVCKGQQVQFLDSSQQGGLSIIKNWSWNFGDNTAVISHSTHTDENHVFTDTGIHIVILTLTNLCNCSSSDTIIVHVQSGKGPTIICKSLVCENQTAAYSVDIPTTPNCNLSGGWSVNCGHIINNYGNAIDVLWDSVGISGQGFVSFNDSICSYLCPGKSTIQIDVIKQNGVAIIGDSTMCSNGVQHQYSLPLWAGMTYSWSVTGATIIHTSSPNQIDVIPDVGVSKVVISCHYSNPINDCYGDAYLTVGVFSTTTINGNASICLNDTAIYTLTGNTGGSWYWQVLQPDSTVITYTIDTLHFAPHLVGVYTITTIGSSLCGEGKILLNAIALPPAPDTIRGADTVCAETYIYNIAHPQTGVNYTWNVVGNASIVGSSTGNQIAIKYNSGNSWQVNVFGTNANGCNSDTTKLTVNKLVVHNSFINFDTTACPDTRKVYEVSYKDGDTYEWTITPVGAGSIASGDGTSKVQILWNHVYAGGYVTIKVSVRKCGVKTTTTKQLYIVAAPILSLTYSDSVCLNTQLHFNITGNIPTTVDSVRWNFGDGQKQTTFNNNSIDYTYTKPIVSNTTYTVSASIKTMQSNGCSYTDATLLNSVVVVKPTPEVSIAPLGLYNIPHNTTANIPLTAFFNANYGNADSLLWVMPSGNVSCANPFSSCQQQTATIVGGYYAIAKNNNGCFSRSDSTVIKYKDTTGICGFANIILTADSVVTCGKTFFKVSWNKPYHQGTWWIGSKEVSTADSFYYEYKDAGEYLVSYNGGFSSDNTMHDLCLQDGKLLLQKVPLVAKLAYTKKCTQNKDKYVVTIGNYSNVLSGVSNVNYSFYVDNTLKQNGSANEYIDSSLALGSSHTAYIAISYIYNGITYQCTTEVQPIDIPTIPSASFKISSKHCEGITIHFTADSAYSSANSYYWEFGDGSQIIVYNPEKEYAYNGLNPTDTATLTVSNGQGCILTSSMPLQVVQNGFSGSLDPRGDTIICPNTAIDINYNKIPTNSTPPDSMYWYDSHRLPLGVPIDSTAFVPYTVNSNGSYWVRVTDNNGCYKNIDGNTIVIVAPIEVPVIVSDPAVPAGDTLIVCGNSTFGLIATLSNNTNVNDYNWYIDGVLYSGGNGISNITIAGNTLSVGVHSIRVETTNIVNSVTGQTCIVSSKTFIVNVLASPTMPTIATPVALSCRTYSIQLTASSNISGVVYHWNNGMTGSSIVVNQGGSYVVTVSNSIGCTASNKKDVPNNPLDYMSSLLRGCYKRCIPVNGIIITAPATQSFAQWQWLLNGQAYTGGYGTVVQPLTILNAGNYNLVLNNGLCSDTTQDLLNITIPNNCPKEQLCSFNVVANSVSFNGSCDTAILHFTITNNNTQPIAYTCIGGIGIGGIAQPGIHADSMFYPSGYGGNRGSTDIEFVFTYTLGSNSYQCDTIDIPFDWNNCFGRIAYPQPTTQQNNDKGYLNIYPTLAKNYTTVSYQYPVNNEQGAKNNEYRNRLIKEKEIVLYNSMGNVVARYSVVEKGSLQIAVNQLPNGLYLMQLLENGKALQAGKLIVVH